MISISGSNEIDILTSEFGGFSITPDGSEIGYPLASYDPYENQSYSSYTYVPVPVLVPVSVIPVIAVEDTQESYNGYGQTPFTRWEDGCPPHSRPISLSQESYDYHFRTWFNTYSSTMTWYQYNMMVDDQPRRRSRRRIFQPPRHSTYN